MFDRKASRFAHSSSLALAVALIVPTAIALPAVAHAQEAEQSFDIPAGDLVGALQAYSARTGVQLVYSSDLVAGKRSPGVSGRMSPQQALGQVLAGTGLSGRMSGNTATLVASQDAGDLAAADGERLLGPVRVEGSQSNDYRTPKRGEGVAQLGGERGRQDEEALGYRARVASATTGSPVALEDIPRTINVVTQELIEKQDITTIGRALEKAPGVTVVETAPGGATNAAIYIRGLPVTSIQIDGGGSGDFRPVGNGELNTDAYERIEIVRGPNALFTGEGSPGGSINLVRKRPGLYPEINLRAEGGSYSRYGAVADLSTPDLFGSGIAFRAVVSGRRQGSEYDGFSTKNATIYGIFDIPLGADARMEAGVNYGISDTKGVNIGLVSSIDGTYFDLPRGFNIDAPGAYSKYRTANIFSKLFVDLDEDWNAEFGLSYKRDTDRGIELSSQYLLRADGSAVFPGFSQIYTSQRTKSVFQDFDISMKITGRFETFGLEHNVFASGQYVLSEAAPSNSLTRMVANIDTLDDLRNPVFDDFGLGEAIKLLVGKRNSTRAGLIIGDTISWRDKVFLSFTARKDAFYSSSVLYSPGNRGAGDAVTTIGTVENSARERSGTWRPSYSLSVKPFRKLTLYASYADGFSRQDESFVVSGQAPNYTFSQATPAAFENYEIGARFATDALLVSASAYNQSLENVVTPVSGLFICPPGFGSAGFNSTCFTQEGVGIKSKGFDLEMTGRIAPGLSMIFNYNYNKNKERSGFFAGRSSVTFSPQSTANLTLDWNPSILPDLSLQATARYKSKYFASGNRDIFDRDGNYVETVPFTIDQAAWAVFDLGIDYRIDENLKARLFVENITDKYYVSTPNTNVPTGGYLGRPRTFLATLTWSKADRNRTLLPGASFLKEPVNWYAAFDAGIGLTGTIRARADGVAQDGASPIVWNYRTSNRPAFAVRLGYKVTPSLRAELEGRRRSAGWNSIGGNAVAPFGVCGSIDSRLGVPFDCDDVPGKIEGWDLMANLLYEIGNKDARVKPFFGGGVGLTRTSVSFSGKMDGIGPDTPWGFSSARPIQETLTAIDSSYGLSWQATAGVGVKLTDRLNLDIAWKYVSTPNARWNSFNIDRPATFQSLQPLTPPVGKFEGKYDTHLFTVGLRWAFGR